LPYWRANAKVGRRDPGHRHLRLAPHSVIVCATTRSKEDPFSPIAIIAAVPSSPAQIACPLAGDYQLVDSTRTGALGTYRDRPPARMLVVGWRIIGLEWRHVLTMRWAVKVKRVEMADGIPGCGPRPLLRSCRPRLAKRLRGDHAAHPCRTASIDAARRAFLSLRGRGRTRQAPALTSLFAGVGRSPSRQAISEPTRADVFAVGMKVFLSCRPSSVDPTFPQSSRSVVPGCRSDVGAQATHEGRWAARRSRRIRRRCLTPPRNRACLHRPEIALMCLLRPMQRRRASVYQVGFFPWAASGRAPQHRPLTDFLTNPGGRPKSKRLLAPDRRVRCSGV